LKRGFTLVEVMVALVISGLALGLAAGGWAALARNSGRIVREAESGTTHGVNQRRLRDLIASMEAGGDSAASFRGFPDGMECTTWLLLPGGWPGRTRLTLRVRDSLLIAETRMGAQVLAEHVTSIRLSYLLNQGLGASWTERWESPITLPSAVRAEVGRWNGMSSVIDTLLVVIGARG